MSTWVCAEGAWEQRWGTCSAERLRPFQHHSDDFARNRLSRGNISRLCWKAQNVDV